ncbi:MAG: glutaredoxin family protein [Dehalococcoidia bacterium]
MAEHGAGVRAARAGVASAKPRPAPPGRTAGRRPQASKLSEPPVVTLYSRPGCHLCVEALGLLHDLSAELGFTVHEVNIEDDDGLLKRYQWSIPVVAVGGKDIAAAPLTRASLRAVLASALGGR